MFYIGMIFLATIVSAGIFPFALRFALQHNIVDNPDARKLQKEPVPVFGSVAVVLGIIIPLLVAAWYEPGIDLWYSVAAIVALFLLGVTDDIRGLSPWLRFIAEMGVIWLLIWHPLVQDNGPMIDNLHGLFGRDGISIFTALPLSLVAGVGIINAINMIDGVDGYSSGFGIVTNLLFAALFGYIGNKTMMLFSAVAAAALIPFYLHNVFGRRSKMFIGDGGSLVIGLVLVNDVFTLLSSQTDTRLLTDQGIGLAALALAILCIPVFDTLRVMTARILEGGSPFEADKTHLHHLFISMGFSHVATSTTIILTDIAIVVLWYAGYRLGLDETGQFAMVVALGLLATCGIYYGFRHAEKTNNRAWRVMTRFGKWTHFEQKGLWHHIETIVDWPN